MPFEEVPSFGPDLGLQEHSGHHHMVAGRDVGLLVAALLVAACGDHKSPTEPPGGATELPRSFLLVGTASGSDGGRSVTCRLDLFFELATEVRRTPEVVEYRGVHGGEVERSLQASDGSGFLFHASVAGEVEARLFVPGRVELVIPVNLDAERPFWRNLARFQGAVDASGRGHGSWTCAPLDLDSGGFKDTSGVVQGSWQFEPRETNL